MQPFDQSRLSASCQIVTFSSVEETGKSGKVTIMSSIADPELWPLIRDHKCNGVNLTPSGLYGDMATTATTHLWNQLMPGDRMPGLNVAEMRVVKTLIASNPQKGSGQWLELVATADLSKSVHERDVRCHSSHVTSEGVKLHDVAHCAVRLEDETTWHAEWTQLSPLIANQIQTLRARALTESTGSIRTVHRARAYELFKTFVEYDGKYQAMSQVIIDSDTLEATAELRMRASKFEGDLVGPYFLDGSCHLSGFVCNATDEDLRKNAYISHGWDAAKLSKEFDPGNGKLLQNYVWMQPEGKDVLGGTVYVLQGDEIVGMWQGVRFRRIPRRVLNVFLPPPKKR